ncbi:AAA family ATPase, partial [Acinetobacter baumannii]|nr:AAA family ATPase [Acinetobacter baumannii]
IELKEDEKSAPAALGFIEHLNSLILGLINDERVNEVPMFYIPRNVTNLKRRVAVCSDALARSMLRNMDNDRVFNWNSSESGFNAYFTPSSLPQ